MSAADGWDGFCVRCGKMRARAGMLCEFCSERLLQAVAELPALWGMRPGIYDVGTGAGEVRSGRLSGSPSLIRLDVMVLDGWGAAGDGVLPVGKTVARWLERVDADLGLRPDGPGVGRAGVLLRVNHDRICARPWAGDYWQDMVAVWRALRRACGLPGPLGRCWGWIANLPYGGCGRWLYAPLEPWVDTVTCPNGRCGRRYTRAGLVKLAIQAEKDGRVPC